MSWPAQLQKIAHDDSGAILTGAMYQGNQLKPNTQADFLTWAGLTGATLSDGSIDLMDGTVFLGNIQLGDILLKAEDETVQIEDAEGFWQRYATVEFIS